MNLASNEAIRKKLFKGRLWMRIWYKLMEGKNIKGPLPKADTTCLQVRRHHLN